MMVLLISCKELLNAVMEVVKGRLYSALFMTFVMFMNFVHYIRYLVYSDKITK